MAEMVLKNSGNLLFTLYSDYQTNTVATQKATLTMARAVAVGMLSYGTQAYGLNKTNLRALQNYQSCCCPSQVASQAHQHLLTRTGRSTSAHHYITTDA